MANYARVRTSLFCCLVAAAAFVVSVLQLPAADEPARKQAAPADLREVPEVFFDELLATTKNREEAINHLTSLIQKAKDLNTKNIDGSIVDLRNRRPDLQGLPFVMGNACRMPAGCFLSFATAGESTHQALARVKAKRPDEKAVADAGVTLISGYQKAYLQIETKKAGMVDPNTVEAQVALPNVVLYALQLRQGVAARKSDPAHAKQPIADGQRAALMQILAPESAQVRIGLANYLARMPHAEATRSLARLAVFSEEPEVRQAACKALQSRDAKDFGDILVQGLNYPWPSVAEAASEAIVRLKRTSMIPELVAVLERPDPRLPRVKEDGSKKVHEVREVVRLNHHRNCLLCHPPGNTADVPADVIKAAIPVPGEPFPQSEEGYLQFPSHPDLLVRIDVTYLRQDFSRWMPVANNAHPWPDLQRFDFLVRTRTVTDQEAQQHRQRIQPARNDLSPYQRAAVLALRELTGRDAEPTAAAWRKVLGSQANR